MSEVNPCLKCDSSKEQNCCGCSEYFNYIGNYPSMDIKINGKTITFNEDGIYTVDVHDGNVVVVREGR